MMRSGEAAKKKGIPIIFDPVGAGASSLRTDTAKKIMENLPLSVIRGNISEIKTLAGAASATKGVDAAVSDMHANSIEYTVNLAKSLAKKTGAVVGISGEVDVATDGERTYLIKNGHADMVKITGTGCMLTGVVAAYCAAKQ